MKKRCPIWLLPKDKFTELVKNSNSISEIIRYFGFINLSGYHKIVKKRCAEENINYSHIKMGRNSNKGRKFPDKAQPLEEVMIKNSTYDTGSLKKRLLKNGSLENKCKICGLEPIWQNKKLVMVLDHINGIRNDHRLENLRLLCSNCNSQTSTFSGKNNRKPHYCKNCKKRKKSKKSRLCAKCLAEDNRKVKNRPTKEQLLREIEESNYCAIGRKYGVTDNAVRKWVK